jgi:hypothetical protein
MRAVPSPGLLSSLLLLASVALAAADAPAPATPAPVRGTRVSMPVPAGFTEATSFSGFQQAGTGSSVLVTELPAPFAQVSSGMTAEQLGPRGMTLLSREPHPAAAPHEGLLVHLEQAAGGTVFRKWIVLLGNASATVLVTATFPAEHAGSLSAPLRSAVLAARWTPQAAATPLPAGFTLTPPPGFAPAQQLQGTVVYTPGGVSGAKGGPLLVAGSSLGAADPGDLGRLSEQRLRQMALVRDVMPEPGKAVSVDGLEGHELVARARDRETGADVVLYQLLLRKPDGYLLVQGRAPAAERERYLPQFQASARGLKRAPEARADSAAPPRGFRFDWPVPSRVRVTERSLERGLRTTLRYDLVLTGRPDGTRVLDVENVGVSELDGVDVSGGKAPPERRALEALIATDARMRLSGDGELLDLEEPEVERILGALRLTPRERKEALARARSPRIQADRRAAAAETWQTWVQAWRGLELERGQRQDITYGPGGEGTVTHLGGDPTRPGAVRLQLHVTSEGPGYEEAFQAHLDALYADPKRTGGKRLRPPRVLAARRVLRVELVTDPKTLRPSTVREEVYGELHVEGEAPSVEKRTVDTTLEWLEPAAP